MEAEGGRPIVPSRFFHFLMIRLIVRILMVAFVELLDSLEWLKLS